MKVLVTGAAGYIGRHIIDKLLDMGAEVIACDLRVSKNDSRVKSIEMNIFEECDDLFARLGSPDVCIHTAWRDGFVHNSPNHIGDLSGHFKFVSSLISGGLRHLVVMGSMHEVGYWEGKIDENTPCNPLSLYGIAKDSLRRALTIYCQQQGCILQWLRGFYILGDDSKNHSIFTKLLAAASEGKKTFPFTTGKTKYDFMSVDCLAQQIAAVAMQEEVTGVINCCSGKPVSLADRVEQYIRDNNLDIKLEYGKYPDRPYDSPCIYGDPEKINRVMDNLKNKAK
jgi:dTDP-6-deoxy-L-talose 4-dehydrogenase (NAD+)